MASFVIGGVASVASCVSCVCCFFCLMGLYRKCLRHRQEAEQHVIVNRLHFETRQRGDNIWSISGNTNVQPHWTDNEGFLSVEHIRIMNERDKPPSYSEDPPSYEQAMRLAQAQSQASADLAEAQTHNSAIGNPSSMPPIITTSPKPAH